MFSREKMMEDLLWEAKAEMENRAGDLERQAQSLRARAKELHLHLDPPVEKAEQE